MNIVERRVELLHAHVENLIERVAALERALEKPQPRPRTFYTILCLDCDDVAESALVIPFGSAEERGKWATKHTAGTGHDRWLVEDEQR